MRCEAYMDNMWAKAGMVAVLVARVDDEGAAEVGIFAVDGWCSGVRGAVHAACSSEAELRQLVDYHVPAAIRRSLTAPCARKLIEGAVAYAAALGFEPHPSYEDARQVLAGIDDGACNEEFVFGRDGRPCFVANAEDPPEFVERALAALRAQCGDDGFTYMAADEDEPVDEIVGAPPDYQAVPPTSGLFADRKDFIGPETDFAVLYADAREYLRDLLAAAPPPALSFPRFAGIVAGIAAGPPVPDDLDALAARLAECAGLEPQEAEDRRRFRRALAVFSFCTSAMFAEEAAKPVEDANPIPMWDVAKGDVPERLRYGIAWARGFTRVPLLWPEVWKDALTRSDVAPHWAVVCAYAHPEAPGAMDIIARKERDSDSLPGAVMAIYRALRSPGGAR